MGEESNLSQKAEVNQGHEVEAKVAEESEGEVVAPVGAEVGAGAEAGAEAEAEAEKTDRGVEVVPKVDKIALVDRDPIVRRADLAGQGPGLDHKEVIIL